VQDLPPTPEPRYLRVSRVLARVIFGWWVVGGGLGCIMSALTAEWVGVALGALVSALGIYGWRLAGRPISRTNPLFYPSWGERGGRSKHKEPR
jgi:hypothetical protein